MHLSKFFYSLPAIWFTRMSSKEPEGVEGVGEEQWIQAWAATLISSRAAVSRFSCLLLLRFVSDKEVTRVSSVFVSARTKIKEEIFSTGIYMYPGMRHLREFTIQSWLLLRSNSFKDRHWSEYLWILSALESCLSCSLFPRDEPYFFLSLIPFNPNLQLILFSLLITLSVFVTGVWAVCSVKEKKQSFFVRPLHSLFLYWKELVTDTRKEKRSRRRRTRLH